MPKQSRFFFVQEALLLQGRPSTGQRSLPVVRGESSAFTQHLSGDVFPAFLLHALEVDGQDASGR
eukprot:3848080-Lingulodinium_polyedra.AAC.1